MAKNRDSAKTRDVHRFDGGNAAMVNRDSAKSGIGLSFSGMWRKNRDSAKTRDLRRFDGGNAAMANGDTEKVGLF